MAVAFGFSFGDFVAALELVSTVVNALGQSSEASHEYRELVRQLYSLETALLQVKGLHLGDSQHKDLVALRQAASQCQQTIDDFWKKIQKYQPHLRSEGSGLRVKDGWMKIKWAICKRDDIAKFKADLMGHTESIQILIATVQM
jgi:Fungal N-terminal domain of STAND proteins